MEESEVPEEPVPEVPVVPEPSEPEVRPSAEGAEPPLKKRGRPKGSLNRKTIEKIKEREPSPAPPAHTLDVDFTSEEILGETLPLPKRKPRKPKPAPPPSSSEEEPPPPKQKREQNRKPRVEPESLYTPTYLEVLTRGLREQRAKQHAEKIAQYDKFFQW